VDELVARLLASAAVWVRIQTSLKNTKWATSAREWPIKQKYTKKTLWGFDNITEILSP
jgi:hypothetical protein